MIDHGKLIVYDTIANVAAKVSGGENVVEVELRRPIEPGLMDKINAAFQGVESAEKKDERTFRIRFSGGIDAQERILAGIVKMNIGIISYKPAALELEDAYLKLIKSTL